MKQRIFTLMAVLMMCMTMSAQNKSPRMSKEDFLKKRELFVTEHAKLAPEEAVNFFPLYNECQEKKGDLNGHIWKLRKGAFNKALSEAEYEKILREIADLRIQIEALEKEYLTKYHKVLSYEKIFAVQGAEAHFQRELLSKMSGRGNKAPTPTKGHKGTGTRR